MRYRICHLTSYAYASPIYESFNEVRLQPMVSATQSVLDFDLRIEPPATVIAFRDYYGNSVHDFGISYLHDRLAIEATSDVVTSAAADEPLLPGISAGTDSSPALRALREDAGVENDFAEFLGQSRFIVLEAESEAIARQLLADHPECTGLSYLDAAAGEVRRRLEYRVGTTTVHSSVAEVLAGGSGVCQDFAHVLISLCRHAGLPARYVSGYLGGVADAAASHAWVEAYVPPYGWLGVDATLGTHCTGQHVKIGVGRDYADVAVLRGTYKGGGHAELEVGVTSETIGAVEPAANARNGLDEPYGRLVAIQNLGAMRRFQRGAVLTQAMGGMRQTMEEGPLPPPRAQTRTEDEPSSEQPHQQQQARSAR